jgi:hypothetical protein
MVIQTKPKVVEASGKLGGSSELNGRGYIKPRLSGFWRGWLSFQFANRPDLNSNALSEIAQCWAERFGRDDAPRRAITYRYQTAFKQLPEEVQGSFKIVEWPQSMHDGALPWESATEVVGLLTWADEHDLPPPTISVAKWYWRISLIAPGASLASRLGVAITASTHNDVNKAFPEDLLNILVTKVIPVNYRPLIADGSASDLWCRLALPRVYAGVPEAPSIFKELLLIDD